MGHHRARNAQRLREAYDRKWKRINEQKETEWSKYGTKLFRLMTPDGQKDIRGTLDEIGIMESNSKILYKYGSVIIPRGDLYPNIPNSKILSAYPVINGQLPEEYTTMAILQGRDGPAYVRKDVLGKLKWIIYQDEKPYFIPPELRCESKG